MDFDPKTVPGLNIEAWQRWVAYRISIKKALKPMSLHAAAVKLAKYGEQQEEVVEQSVSNQWQGLFDLQVVKPMPGEKPKKLASSWRQMLPVMNLYRSKRRNQPLLFPPTRWVNCG